MYGHSYVNCFQVTVMFKMITRERATAHFGHARVSRPLAVLRDPHSTLSPRTRKVAKHIITLMRQSFTGSTPAMRHRQFLCALLHWCGFWAACEMLVTRYRIDGEDIADLVHHCVSTVPVAIGGEHIPTCAPDVSALPVASMADHISASGETLRSTSGGIANSLDADVVGLRVETSLLGFIDKARTEISRHPGSGSEMKLKTNVGQAASERSGQCDDVAMGAVHALCFRQQEDVISVSSASSMDADPSDSATN
jgi:hypothetical protein